MFFVKILHLASSYPSNADKLTKSIFLVFPSLKIKIQENGGHTYKQYMIMYNDLFM